MIIVDDDGDFWFNLIHDKTNGLYKGKCVLMTSDGFPNIYHYVVERCVIIIDG